MQQTADSSRLFAFLLHLHMTRSHGRDIITNMAAGEHSDGHTTSRETNERVQIIVEGCLDEKNHESSNNVRSSDAEREDTISSVVLKSGAQIA